MFYIYFQNLYLLTCKIKLGKKDINTDDHTVTSGEKVTEPMLTNKFVNYNLSTNSPVSQEHTVLHYGLLEIMHNSKN